VTTNNSTLFNYPIIITLTQTSIYFTPQSAIQYTFYLTQVTNWWKFITDKNLKYFMIIQRMALQIF